MLRVGKLGTTRGNNKDGVRGGGEENGKSMGGYMQYGQGKEGGGWGRELVNRTEELGGGREIRGREGGHAIGRVMA